MINLPGNRRMGKVYISPKNWKTGGKSLLKEMWFIRYRYYDDNKGVSKQIWISDFNRVNDLNERRQHLQDALDAEIELYRNSDDEYFRARSADLEDIRDTVLDHLYGSHAQFSVPPGAIIAARDLAPSRFLLVDWSRGGARDRSRTNSPA